APGPPGARGQRRPGRVRKAGRPSPRRHVATDGGVTSCAAWTGAQQIRVRPGDRQEQPLATERSLMRFALKTRPEHQTWEELRDLWVAADEVPLFESMWNWDHFYPLTGDLHGPNFEGWTMLSAMAALTSRIRIGCQVTAMPYRHPAVLANMAATVDHISAGRLILGIGAAWNEMECNAYGFPLPPLKERFDRFDEGSEVLTQLLSSRVSNYAGKYFTLTDAYCEPKPVQRPYPPITIGGNGPKRTLRAVARWASEWNGSVQEPARYAEPQ